MNGFRENAVLMWEQRSCAATSYLNWTPLRDRLPHSPQECISIGSGKFEKEVKEVFP
jgi:hypothetical protein